MLRSPLRNGDSLNCGDRNEIFKQERNEIAQHYGWRNHVNKKETKSKLKSLSLFCEMAAPKLLDKIHVQWRFGAGGRFFLFGALFTVWFVSPTETLEVTIFANPKSVLVNEDISLECKFTGYDAAGFSLDNVGVQWIGPNGQDIYVFNGGIASPKRNGAKMSTADLQKGDASLHLLDIQLTEEGQYTCIVFVTPEKVEKKSGLEVSARPAVSLSTEQINILIGSEGTLSCDVTGFYPKQHELVWQYIPNTESKKPKELKDKICTGATTPSNNGTFSVSSRIRIVPTLYDDGDVYRCLVTHRSARPDGISQESTLKVEEPKEYSAVPAVVTSIIVTLLVCAASVLAAILYWRKFRGVPPEITVSKPSIIRHLEEATISYQVLRFRPREITIYLLMKRMGHQTGRKIFEWQSSENRTSSAPRDTTNEVQLLINGNERDPSFPSWQPVFSDNGDGTFKVQGDIKMYPDVFKDNEAELILHVHHKTCAQPAVKSMTLDVRGVPPKVSNIVVPLHTHHNELVALTCSINGFKPRPLTIIWQQMRMNSGLKEIVRLDQNNRTIVAPDHGMMRKCDHQISEVEYEDKSYGITSILIIMPDILQDQGTKYICEVQHECTKSVERKEITLNVTAPPKLDIITSTEKTIAGEPMTLYCRIHSFYPKIISVTWLKSGEIMTEESEESEPTLGSDGLYCLTSSVKSLPTRADVEKTYTCQVEHESLIKPSEVNWVLDRLVSVPKVTEVTADPVHPEVGKSVTLSCKAFNFFPEDNKIFWFKGFEKTEDGVQTDDVQLDRATGLYSRWSKRTFIPTHLDHGKEFKMQILHSETSNKPISSSHFLKIMGIPSVEEIKFDPPEATYGSDLVLICSISNFYPQTIETVWRNKGGQIIKGITIKGPVKDESGCYRLTSQLQVKPTAQDYDEVFSFHVNHVKLKAPIVKQTYLTLPAHSPALSSIKVDPTHPEAGQLVTFSISLASYAPEAVQMKWFKNGKSCSGLVNTRPVIADDGLFSSVASIQFMANENDHESLIRCEVLHIATNEIQDKNFKLLLKGIGSEDAVYEIQGNDEENFQEVSQITCRTECPKAGQPVTVSCTITGSAVEDTHLTWYREVYPFEDMSCITNTPFKTGVGFTTALTYVPKQEDGNCKLQIEVITEMDPICREFQLKLSGVGISGTGSSSL
ncbi:uncharacterized protein LOC144498906 [Mustelus asterias]